MRFVVVGLFFFVVAATSACFELPRSAGVTEGQVRFTVRDSAGAPVAGAVVTVDGAARLAVSNADGLVSLERLVPGDYVVRVAVDDDNDGTVDRAAILTGSIARTNIATGTFTAPVEKLTSDLPADVTVAAVGNVSVTLTGCDVDDLCRAVAFRDVSVARDGHVVTGVVEVGARVAGGNLQLVGVAPGAVRVAAFSWPRPVETDVVQQAIAAARTVDGFALGEVDVVSGDTATLALTLAATPASVSTSVELGGEPALFERPAGAISFFAPQTTTDVDAALAGTVTGVVSDVDAPVGVFDLQVNLDSGEGGLLAHAVAAPGVDNALGPVELALAKDTGCTQTQAGPDCDDDGLGADNDEDDDHDGVADADEPAACRAPGAGADVDGDCLCDAADPFPDCASNDPVACDLAVIPDCP